MTEIIHHKKENGGQFEIFYEGKHAGQMDYIAKDNEITITHTFVDEEFGGKGLAKLLVLESVKYAKENDIVLNATCSYAKSVLGRLNS